MNGLAKALDRSRVNASAPVGCVVLLSAALAGVSALVGDRFNLDAAYPVRVLAAFLLIGVLVIVLARKHLPEPSLGAANQVTLGRAALTALLIGLLGERAAPSLAWSAVIIAIIVLILDGVDGAIARRQGRASRFGARFDMETDALLILVLALLAWQFAKAGPWVLAAGLVRYVFVAAAGVWPWLRAPLPPSRRRQAVCVAQVGTLIVCLAPFVSRPSSGIVASVGVAALIWSFAVDVAWLAHNRR